jgi:hypothetical protein
MTFLLYFRETLILPYAADQIKEKLAQQIMSVQSLRRPYSASLMAVDVYKFNGFFKKDEFRIFRALQAPQNFIPLVIGKIEPTSKGCIVFLKYKLFLSTRMFLVFWLLVCVFFTFFFLFYYPHILLAIVSFILGLLNYLIAVAGFRMHLKKTRKELHEILG